MCAYLTYKNIEEVYLNGFWFPGVDVSDAIVFLLVEGDSLDVVKDAQQVGLDGVGVRGLSENLKESRVRHKEEAWEDESLLLQVPSEGLLTELQLLQEMREQLTQCLITHATRHHIGNLVGLCENLNPRLVDISKPLGFLYVDGCIV